MSKQFTVRVRNAEDERLYESFMEKCSQNKTDASTEIRKFMERYNKKFERTISPTPPKKVKKEKPKPEPKKTEIVVKERTWEDIENEIKAKKYPHEFELYFYKVVKKALIEKSINGYQDITEEDIEEGYKYWGKNIQR